MRCCFSISISRVSSSIFLSCSRSFLLLRHTMRSCGIPTATTIKAISHVILFLKIYIALAVLMKQRI